MGTIVSKLRTPVLNGKQPVTAVAQAIKNKTGQNCHFLKTLLVTALINSTVKGSLCR